MIQQKYIDALSKERKDLLWRRDVSNFFQKLFYRKYTDWIMTDEVNVYSRQEYLTDCWHSFKEPVGKPKTITKQVSVRMKLSDGEIEVNETEV